MLGQERPRGHAKTAGLVLAPLCFVLILLLLGRGDYGKEEWKTLVAEAETVRAQRGADYFLGLPLLAEHLEDGLNLLGYSCGPAA